MVGLVGFLQGNSEVRRLFGKRELVIIKKQAWGVKLTQSERNRLSRDIRRKLEVVVQLAEFKDEFRLKCGSALKERIGQVMAAIHRHPLFLKIRRVWLYGSTVDEERTLDSDIDVAVEFEGVSEAEGWNFRRRVMGPFDEKIDVQVYNFLPAALKNEIRKGRILYEKKDRGKVRRD